MEPESSNELIELLDSKSFKQLSKSEKIVVLDTMIAEEYESFRTFLLFCESSFKETYGQQVPNPEIKENLKVAFRERYKKKSTGMETSEKILLNPLFLIGTACIILILIGVHFFSSEKTELVDSNNQVTGMNIEQIKDFEDMIEHMSLDETCIHSQLIVPELNTAERLLVNSEALVTP